MNVPLRNCEPGQVVLWNPIATFRWLLLEVKNRTSTYQVECEVIACPILVYGLNSRYAVGTTAIWESRTQVTLMSEMEVLAWSAR